MSYKIFVFSLLASVVFSACSNPEPAEIAAKTAKLYYSYLLEGKYNEFLEGEYRADSIPDSYHSQLVDNAKMFVHQNRKRNKGIKSIESGRSTYDEKTHTANVFLIFTYGNGRTEQVLVPMLEKGGVWYMR